MQNSKMKKGVSPIIAFVLLIGFGVALGAFFFQWAKQQVESSTDTATVKYASEVLCSEVSFSSNYSSCPFSTLNIKNSGYHKIVAFEARLPSGSQQRLSIDIPPQIISTLSLPVQIQSGENLELIPFILSDKGEHLACPTRISKITC